MARAWTARGTALLLGAVLVTAPARAEQRTENDAYKFVTEYVRELGALEKIRDKAMADFDAKDSNRFADCIRNTTRFQLELNTSISRLKEFSLPLPVPELIPDIIVLYERKLDQYQELQDTCSKLIAGPQPGVDYGALAAETPKITARIEYLDETLFKVIPLVFAVLIDQKPDSQNHLSHLVITRTQRDKLVREIDWNFGKKIKQDNQNYTVSAATVLRSYLAEKGYLCADDPWK